MKTQSQVSRTYVAILGGVCALMLGSAPSLEAAVDTAGGTQLEEIVVTAQKRTEDIQQVPVSAQVLTGQVLAEQNHLSLEELTLTVPSVHVDTGGFSNNIFIRGIGSGQNADFDQSVAMFDDDIYHGRSKLTEMTFLDLDRIEILKGPQSTFFGNNAVAGALNIVTKKPGDTFDASGRLLYGQFGQYVAEGAIGGPITDTLGVRLAVTRNGESGWIENVNTGQKAPDTNNEAARATLVFKPNDSLDVTFKIEGSDNKLAGSASDSPVQWTNCPAAPPIGANVPGGQCPLALTLGNAVPMGLNNNLNTGLAGQGVSLSTFEDVLTANYRQWGQTFTSITGFYNYHSELQSDVYQLPEFLLTNQLAEKYHQFSEELRVASPAGSTIQYLAGTYFQTDQLDYRAQANGPFLDFLATLSPFAALAPYLPVNVAPSFVQSEHIDSVFGSLGWNISDRLRLTAGLRGSWVQKDSDGTVAYGYDPTNQLYGGFAPIPSALESLWGVVLGPPGEHGLSRSDHAWMPSAGAQYQIDSDRMLYFSYTRGFKSGGINAQNGLGIPSTEEYGPEHVNAYELGLKSKWFNDRLLINLDVFRSDYQGLQVDESLFHPESNVYTAEVGNAGSARSQGVELESQWVITKEFRVSANVTYLDSYYVSFPDASATTLALFNGVQVSDLSGQATQYAPRWSGSLNARYTLFLPGGFQFITQASPYFSSRYFIQSGDPFYIVDAYTRLDGRVSLESPDGHWAVDIIGKNLTDRIITTGWGGSFNLESKQEPRNVAVQVRYHF
jgi:iron complex outermembrane recepter protein